MGRVLERTPCKGSGGHAELAERPCGKGRNCQCSLGLIVLVGFMAVLNKEYHSLVSAIQTDCIVMPSIEEITQSKQLRYTEVKSMVWDTGATNTLVSSQVVEALGLVPLEKSRVEGVGGIIESSVSEISIYLADNIVFKNVKVLCSDIGDYDLVVGMDIIAQGDFVISNNKGQVCFSFRYPSKDKIILGP